MKKGYIWMMFFLLIAFSIIGLIFAMDDSVDGEISKKESDINSSLDLENNLLTTKDMPNLIEQFEKAYEYGIEMRSEMLKAQMIGKTQSPLTGLLIDEKIAKKRPFAVMISNIKMALPQSGISEADIIYETLAEGGITRLLAIYQDFKCNKVGPIRSARPYYLDFALDNDAIYIHHGGSEQAYNEINNLGINNFDGMALEGSVFYRDKERLKKPNMYEHSSYTTAENILAAMERYNYRSEKENGFYQMFQFHDEDWDGKEILGEDAYNIAVLFSHSHKGEFAYDEETKLYKRSQNGNIHIDQENNEQVSVKNIIIQFADISVVDNIGRLKIGLVSSGNGICISNGASREIKWRKDSRKNPTVWTETNGDKLTINKGKTWICVVPLNTDIDISANTN